MLNKKILNTQISEEMKKIILSRLSDSKLSNPVPSIMFGSHGNEEDESYFLSVYDREEIPTSEPIAFVEIDGIEFLIIQGWLCDELETKIIDIENGRLTVIDKKNE